MSRMLEDFMDRFTTRQKLFLIICLGFFPRLYVALNAATISIDSIGYLDTAMKFSNPWSFEWLSVTFTPLYPMLVAMVQVFVQDYTISGRIVSVVFGTMAIPASYYLGRIICDEKVGLLTALLVAIQSFMIICSGAVITEGLQYFLMPAATVFWIRAVFKLDMKSAVFAGILTTLAYLNRPEMLGLLVITSLWVIFYRLSHIREDWKKRALILGVGWGIFFVLAAPYLIFFYNFTGEVTLSAKGSISRIISVLPHNIVGYLYDAFEDIPKAVGISIFVVFLYGLFRRWKERLTPPEWYVLSIVLSFWVFYIIVLPIRRYFVEVMPLALVFAAIGLVSIEKRLMEKGVRRARASLVVVIVVLIIVALELPRGMIVLSENRIPERRMGELVLKMEGEGEVIISRKPIVSYYAKGVYSQIEKGTTLAEIAAFAGRTGIKYMTGYDMRLRQDIKGFDADKELFLDEIKVFERAGGSRKYRLYVFKDIKDAGGHVLSSP